MQTYVDCPITEACLELRAVTLTVTVLCARHTPRIVQTFLKQNSIKTVSEQYQTTLKTNKKTQPNTKSNKKTKRNTGASGHRGGVRSTVYNGARA